MSRGPLSERPASMVNYRLEGPGHRLYCDGFPRRVRAVLNERAVLDSVHAMLLHETGEPPVLYVPTQDVVGHLLERSETVTDDARAHGVDDVAWCYREPRPEAAGIAGYWCFDESKADVRADSRAAPVQRVVRTPEPPTEPAARLRDNLRQRFSGSGSESS